MQGATQISTALGSHSFPSASHQQQQGSQASKQAAMGLVVLGFQQVRGPPTLARTHTHAHATRNNKRNVKSWSSLPREGGVPAGRSLGAPPAAPPPPLEARCLGPMRIAASLAHVRHPLRQPLGEGARAGGGLLRREPRPPAGGGGLGVGGEGRHAVSSPVPSGVRGPAAHGHHGLEQVRLGGVRGGCRIRGPAAAGQPQHLLIKKQ